VSLSRAYAPVIKLSGSLRLEYLLDKAAVLDKEALFY
jgi:hypothetical protein